MEHPDLPVLERKGFRWSLSCVPMMESYLHILDGDPLQDIVRSVIQQYKTLVAPKYSEFSKGEYHVQVQISSKFFKKRVNSASYGWDS